jgi:hypothetical protein
MSEPWTSPRTPASEGVDVIRGCGGREVGIYYRALAPYWDRAFLRSETPAASRVPRTTL